MFQNQTLSDAITKLFDEYGTAETVRHVGLILGERYNAHVDNADGTSDASLDALWLSQTMTDAVVAHLEPYDAEVREA